MNKSNKIKDTQLGIPKGTASARLRKNILFNLLKKHGENICFQCGNSIEIVDDLSIEHKIPWLHSENPSELFFSLDNIGFSHLDCNIKAGRRHRGLSCGTHSKYSAGCRCKECTKAHRDSNQRNREKKKKCQFSQAHNLE